MASTGCSRKTCFNAIQTDYLYENHSAENGNNWLEIKLAGTTSNRSAIGAKVRVTANQCLTLVEGQAPTSATQPPSSICPRMYAPSVALSRGVGETLWE